MSGIHIRFVAELAATFQQALARQALQTAIAEHRRFVALAVKRVEQWRQPERHYYRKWRYFVQHNRQRGRANPEQLDKAQLLDLKERGYTLKAEGRIALLRATLWSFRQCPYAVQHQWNPCQERRELMQFWARRRQVRFLESWRTRQLERKATFISAEDYAAEIEAEEFAAWKAERASDRVNGQLATDVPTGTTVHLRLNGLQINGSARSKGLE